MANIYHQRAAARTSVTAHGQAKRCQSVSALWTKCVAKLCFSSTCQMTIFRSSWRAQREAVCSLTLHRRLISLDDYLLGCFQHLPVSVPISESRGDGHSYRVSRSAFGTAVWLSHSIVDSFVCRVHSDTFLFLPEKEYTPVSGIRFSEPLLSRRARISSTSLFLSFESIALESKKKKKNQSKKKPSEEELALMLWQRKDN